MNHESGDLPKNCSIISGLGNKVHNSKNVESVHFMAFSGSGKGFFIFLQLPSRIFAGNLPAASSRRCRTGGGLSGNRAGILGSRAAVCVQFPPASIAAEAARRGMGCRGPSDYKKVRLPAPFLLET